MTEDEIRTVVLNALSNIAPEADLSSLDPRAELRALVDLDSMDFLNFVVALHETTGIEIPESDYAKLSSLADCIRYLSARAPNA